jgi:hypothetical protein
MNRLMRPMTRFGKSFSARRSQGQMVNKEADLYAANTPQDVTSARARATATASRPRTSGISELAHGRSPLETAAQSVRRNSIEPARTRAS